MGGPPNTPPAKTFTSSSPPDSIFTFSAQAAKILSAINALGGSKVANLSSIESADAEEIKPKVKTPNKKAIKVFFILRPPLKNV